MKRFLIKDAEIPVASLEDLLYLKISAGRLKDKYDITILECLNGLREDEEIQEYLNKFKDRAPYERLVFMTELINFSLKFRISESMAPERKEFFRKYRLENFDI